MTQDTATRKTLAEVSGGCSQAAESKSWEPGRREFDRSACGKPEGLVRNVSLRTRGSTLGGMTGHVTSYGDTFCTERYELQ